MSGRTKTGRNATAIALSVIAHVIMLAVLIITPKPNYTFPPPSKQPIADVEIVPMPPLPPIPPPPKIPLPKTEPKPMPPPTPPKLEPPKPTPPKPEPAKPEPPKPEPPKPEPPKPTPPTPMPPRPEPPKPSPLPAPAAPPRAPTPTPAPKPTPNPTAAVAKSPPTPTPGPPKPAPPAIVSTPSLLNIHKSVKKAPGDVPVLPMAPAAGQPGSPAGGAPSIAAAPGAPGAPGQSRLNGLNPYPYGAMPSGGPGLRGTLVGCANSDAVGLSNAERTHCNERFGVDAAHAPVLDPISREKRSGFDKDAERQDRSIHSGMPTGTTQGAHGFGGLGPN